MKMNYAGKNIDVTDSLRDIAGNKLSKLDKYFDKDIEGDITFSTEKDRKIVEVTINLPGTIIRAEETSDDMYASIDKVVDRLERQIRKYKTKLRDRYQDNKSIRFDYLNSIQSKNEAKEDDSPKLARRKKIGLKPMDYEEAILQMELLGHDFFVFRDGETAETKVVYKRKQGDYGLIEPQN